MKKLLILLIIICSVQFATGQEKTETFKERLEKRLQENRFNFQQADSTFILKFLKKQTFGLSASELKSVIPKTNSHEVLKLINLKPKWYQFRKRKDWRKKFNSFIL